MMSVLPGFISREEFDIEKIVNRLPLYVRPPKEGYIAVRLLENNVTDVTYAILYIRPISQDVNFVYTSKGEFNIVSNREMRDFLERLNKQTPLEAPVDFLMQFFSD